MESFACWGTPRGAFHDLVGDAFLNFLVEQIVAFKRCVGTLIFIPQSCHGFLPSLAAVFSTSLPKTHWFWAVCYTAKPGIPGASVRLLP